MRLRTLVAVCITAIAIAFISVRPSYAATVNFGGTFNVGDPRMARVNDGSGSYPYPCLVQPATQVLYHVYPFYVTADGSYAFEVTFAAFIPIETDTLLALYQGSFSAGSPATNCLTSDDDTGAGFYSLATYNLTAGTQYFMLLQAYDAPSNSGTYAGTAKGLGTVIFGTLPGAVVGSSAATPPDDRLNWLFGDDYVVAYPGQDADGEPTLQLYCIGTDSVGTIRAVISQADFAAASENLSENTLVAEVDTCRVPVSVYVLTTGEYQLNIGPNAEGTVLSVIWTGLPPSDIYERYYNIYQP